MPFVILSTVAGVPERLELPGPHCGIGRGTGCDLRLAEDSTVDLEHCRISEDEHGYELADLGSLTGTYVNGEKVETVRLAHGDKIGVGGFELAAELGPSGLVLRLRGAASSFITVASASAKAPAPPAPIDYAAAYALARPGLLNKAALSFAVFAACALGASVVGALVLAGRTTLPRPGPVSTAHAAVDLGITCASCHAPFRGAASARCESCHQGPEHQARQASAPACGSCHFEHRRLSRLAEVPDGRCAECHRELEVKGGGEPRVARSLLSFDDHPEFQPKADATPLFFNHAVHLKPGLPVEGGNRVTLTCDSCHAFNAERGEILPVSFDQHCQKCHALLFDDRFPPARHGEPQRVVKEVLGAFAGDPAGASRLSGDDLRRLIFGQRSGGLAYDEATRRQALVAADQLFRHQCTRCHRIEVVNALRVEVQPVRPPGGWLPGARFSHGPHRLVACTECHASAAASRRTADVLIPAKAACVACHGAGKEVATGCVTCHHYHEKSAAGWEATLPARNKTG